MEIPNDVLRGDGFEVMDSRGRFRHALNTAWSTRRRTAVAGPQVSCWIASKANKVGADSIY